MLTQLSGNRKSLKGIDDDPSFRLIEVAKGLGSCDSENARSEIRSRDLAQ